MLIGYARVSTGLQNLDLQKDMLTKNGCQKIFTDKISGTKSKRQGLNLALDYLRPNDTLVVWRLDRLGRNLEELIKIVNNLNNNNIHLQSIQENLALNKSNATGQLMFHLFAAFAQFEHNLIQERTTAGRIAAKKRGQTGGRPEKLTPNEVKLIKTLANNHTPIKTLAKQWNVSRTTIYRYLNKTTTTPLPPTNDNENTTGPAPS
jgi:DNA invertase Pin-like site-specific DNA recombinase